MGDDRELLHLLQTSDTMFPVGAFAHSVGLEGLVDAGRVQGPENLDPVMRSDLHRLLADLDFPLIRLASEAAGNNDSETLAGLAERSRALRASSEQRDAVERIGRQRLAMLIDLQPPENSRRLTRLTASLPVPGLPVVCGIESAVCGIDPASMMYAYGYQAFAGFLSASMKLIRIGQLAVQRLLHDHLRELPGLLEQSRYVDRETMGCFTPVLDIAQARHETAYTRIFIS